MRPGLAAVAVACLSGACLSMSDGPFASGRGEIAGRAMAAGSPAAGALVHLIDRPELPLVRADDDGRFLISGVPAGWQEIMLRAPEVNCAFRGGVLVARERRSDLGEIDLPPAGTLLLHLQDGSEKNDLDLEDATVAVREAPELAAVTDFGGLASLGPLPRSGCYRIVVEREPFEFDEDTLCLKDTQWGSQVTISPKKTTESVYLKLHHALKKLEDLVHSNACAENTCEVPEFWQDNQSPPCAWPVKNFGQDTETLRIVIEAVRATGRFSQNPWNTIGCPDAYPAAICRDSECRFEPDFGVEVVEVAKGLCDASCPTATSLELSTREDVATLLSSLGVSNATIPPEASRFLFFRTLASDVPPEPVFFGLGSEERILFFRGGIGSGAKDLPTRVGASAWVIVALIDRNGLLPESLSGKLAWLRAL